MSKRTWQPPADALPGDTFRAGRRVWSATEDAILRAEYPDNPTVPIALRLRRTLSSTYGRATTLGLKKSAVYLASPDACRLRREQTPAQMAHRFRKGLIPHNKGLRGRKGYAPGRMAETQFKPGVRAGIAAKNWVPIGTRLKDSDGYWRIKIREGVKGESYGFGNMKIWPLLNRHVWAEAHGPIPHGHAVIFRDGNRDHCDIDNLELISRRDLMLRNSVHNLPKPVARAVQLLGALNRQIRRRKKHA